MGGPCLLYNESVCLAMTLLWAAEVDLSRLTFLEWTETVIAGFQASSTRRS